MNHKFILTFQTMHKNEKGERGFVIHKKEFSTWEELSLAVKAELEGFAVNYYITFPSVLTYSNI